VTPEDLSKAARDRISNDFRPKVYPSVEAARKALAEKEEVRKGGKSGPQTLSPGA
jgi:hypothetical protein